MRIECLPAKLPIRTSRRLPGGTATSPRTPALFSCTSFRRATLAKLVGKPLGTCRSLRIISANLPLKDRITSLFPELNVSCRDTTGQAKRLVPRAVHPRAGHSTWFSPWVGALEGLRAVAAKSRSVRLGRGVLFSSAFLRSAPFRRRVGWDRQSWQNARGGRLVHGDGLRGGLRPGRLPELLGNWDRIDPSRFPPQRLAARAVELAVVQAAERNREFVADLAPEGELLGEAHVVRFGGLAPANEARSGSDVFQMIFVAEAPRFPECEDALVDAVGAIRQAQKADRDVPRCTRRVWPAARRVKFLAHHLRRRRHPGGIRGRAGRRPGEHPPRLMASLRSGESFGRPAESRSASAAAQSRSPAKSRQSGDARRRTSYSPSAIKIFQSSGSPAWPSVPSARRRYALRRSSRYEAGIWAIPPQKPHAKVRA